MSDLRRVFIPGRYMTMGRGADAFFTEEKVFERHSIYQLVDPRDGFPHYIGLARDMERRLYQHIRGDGSGNVFKDSWIEELAALGLTPIMEEIEVVDGSLRDAVEREQHWIRFFVGEGMPLTNIIGVVEDNRARMGYTINHELIKECKRIAFETGCKPYEVVEKAIKQYIDMYNQQ